MDLPEILSSIAGGAITLAGFSAAFRAFSGHSESDGQSRIRLNSVIEGGLLVAFVCYLPIVLSELNISTSMVWRTSCFVIMVWGVLRIIVPTLKILKNVRPLPELFKSVVFAGLFSLLCSLITTIGLWPFDSYSGYLVSVLALLANISLVFIAQFRTEQIDQK